MAFKMKGSAFKLGNIATKSVLKQTSPMKDTGESYLEKVRNTEQGVDAHDRQYAKNHDKLHAANDPNNPAHEETEPTPIEEQPAAPKMKSPMKFTGIYKTLDDGTMIQVPRSEYEEDMETEGDGGSYTLTGSDVVKEHPKWGEDAKKALQAKTNVHMAEDVYNLGDARSKYTDAGVKRRRKAQEIDDRIQAKIDQGLPLNEEELKYQRRALINLAREDKENI